MNFNGYSCPKCGRSVTRNKRFYKCRCGWSYKEPSENYRVQLRKRLEQYYGDNKYNRVTEN